MTQKLHKINTMLGYYTSLSNLLYEKNIYSLLYFVEAIASIFYLIKNKN